MSNLRIGAGAYLRLVESGRTGRRTMRACLVVLLWASASPGYALVAAGNLDHAVFVAEPVERDGDAGAIVSLEAGRPHIKSLSHQYDLSQNHYPGL